MGVRIYSAEEAKKYCKEIYGGYEFNFKGVQAHGVHLHSFYEPIPVDIVVEILDEINEVFPLHWTDLDLLCVPFRPMIYKDGWSGTDYNGRAWKGIIILGARRKTDTREQLRKEVASMLIHELWHEFAYRFVDEEPFDGRDTEVYKKFKQLMNIEEYEDTTKELWEDRPSEILAELGRFYSGKELFTWENFVPFDSKNDPKPRKEAYDYLMSLMPPKPENYDDFIENRPKSTTPTMPGDNREEVKDDKDRKEDGAMQTKKDIIIALDDGHGSSTPGKRTPRFPDGVVMKENEFNSRVVELLDIELKRNGFKTVLVAPTNEDTPLSERVNTANKAKADLYLSVHANALKGTWGDWGGIETYHYPGSAKGKQYAEIVHKHLLGGTKLRDRGVKSANFYVLRKTAMPAVLAECGFMDNLKEAGYLRSEEYRKECAVELAKAVCEIFDKDYIPEQTKEKDEDQAIIKNGTPIMGKAVATKEQMKTYLLKINPNPKINCTIDELIDYYLMHGEMEGVRGDIAFAQSIHETGYFRFGGQVLPEQNNFAGIGATNNSPVGKGAWFDTPSEGVLAQIQHLKAYGSIESLNTECVDPRFTLVKRGSAPYVEQLAQALNPSGVGWAFPGYNKARYKTVKEAYEAGMTYGQSILRILNAILETEVETKPIEANPKNPSNSIDLDELKKELKDVIMKLFVEQNESITSIGNKLKEVENRIEQITEILNKHEKTFKQIKNSIK